MGVDQIKRGLASLAATPSLSWLLIRAISKETGIDHRYSHERSFGPRVALTAKAASSRSIIFVIWTQQPCLRLS